LRPNLTATVGLETILVILSGPLLAMENLDATSVEAVLDLSNYVAGDYLITPRIIVPDEIEIESFTPQAVPIKIEAVPRATPTP
jgi:hypothetical protein